MKEIEEKEEKSYDTPLRNKSLYDAPLYDTLNSISNPKS